VTIAPGLQVKDPSRRPKRCTTLNVFRDSAAGALPAIWTKLPQILVLRGEDRGWRKIAKQCKNFLIGRKPKIRKNTQVKKEECNRTACCLELYSLEPGTKLGKYRLEQRG